MKMVTSRYLCGLKTLINKLFGHGEPWQVASITASSILVSIWFYHLVTDGEGIKEKTKKTFFKWLRRIPAVRRKIKQEMTKMQSDFYKDVTKRMGDLPGLHEMPLEGLTSDQVIQEVEKHLALGIYDWKRGKVSGAVYCQDPGLLELTTQVYGKASYTNPLHADVFPGVNKMEAEVVAMAINLFHGGSDGCGTMTGGGTESILMACKAYRDLARSKGVKRPEMVVPRTAHSAFDKAAQYLNIIVRSIPVDPRTLKVDVNKMKAAINRNTCMLVGSAPNFPYGTIDDICSIAELGVKYKVPVHVDACLGGFLIAFMERAGYSLPPFDFSLHGVTSMSADTHKYGFAPKGSSVILYRAHKYLHHQYTVTTDWPGGVYGSPTVSGSRPGGVIAACWATLRYFGMSKYVEMTRSIISTARYIEDKLRQIKGIYVFGTPATSVIAFGSEVFDIFLLMGELHKLGWSINALQYPSGVHLCVTMLHTSPGVADSFVEDVRNQVAIIMKGPIAKPIEGKMAVYGVSQDIPDRSLVSEITKLFIDSMYYVPDGKGGPATAASTP